MDLHENYDKLTDKGTKIVAEWYNVLYKHAELYNEINLKTDDDAERFVDSLAVLLLDSTDNKHLRPEFCKKCRCQLSENEVDMHDYCR